MRVLHVADTHIGYSAYNKLDQNGLNQRESDVYSAFSQVVDHALEHDVDLFLHAGDLFDTVRPSNRAISFAVQQLLRLSRAGIPTVIVSGNHETPRLRETGSVFRVFEHIENLFLAYSGTAQTFSFGDIAVHCLPHCADKELFNTELDKMQPEPGIFNIAMLHAAVSGLSVFRMNEFNELMASNSQLDRGWDYVALGHYHEHVEVMPNVVYSGSTERFGFGQVGQPKGFVLLDTDTAKWEFLEISPRSMIDLPTVDCQGLGAQEIFSIAHSNLEAQDIEGAVVRQKLDSIDRRTLGHLDISSIRKRASAALQFELKPSVRDSEQKLSSQDAAFDSLEREFTSYISEIPVEGADPEKLEALGLRYLAGDEQ